MSNKLQHAFVVSAPSGAGKTTLIRHLLPLHPELEFSISCTTRPPRNGEQPGAGYSYLSVDDFQKLIDQGEFLEWEEVHGQYYGTPKSELTRITEQGRYPLFDLDVKGALTLKRNLEYPHLIFITVPDPHEYLKRLQGRGTETEAQIARRLERVELEMSRADEFHYQVVNDDLDRAVQELSNLIQTILQTNRVEE